MTSSEASRSRTSTASKLACTAGSNRRRRGGMHLRWNYDEIDERTLEGEFLDAS